MPGMPHLIIQIVIRKGDCMLSTKKLFCNYSKVWRHADLVLNWIQKHLRYAERNFEHFMRILCEFFGFLPTSLMHCFRDTTLFFPGTKNHVSRGPTVALPNLPTDLPTKPFPPTTPQQTPKQTPQQPPDNPCRNLQLQSNLALRNFFVTTKKFLKVKSSLF